MIEIINTNLLLLHLVGCLCYCIGDARSHRHEISLGRFFFYFLSDEYEKEHKTKLDVIGCYRTLEIVWFLDGDAHLRGNLRFHNKRALRLYLAAIKRTGVVNSRRQVDGRQQDRRLHGGFNEVLCSV